MKLHDQVRQKLRLLHYSWATEEAYLGWIERFVRFHRRGTAWRHPRELGAAEIEEFLGYLARDRQVSASTQNQAFTFRLLPPFSLLTQSVRTCG